MAFRKKAGFILAHKPDILIIQECEHPDKLKFASELQLPTDLFWYGTNQHKGLGVFSYSNYKLQLLDCHNPNFKNILPIAITGGKVDFILFAVWANNPDDKDGQYVTQVWKAIQHYDLLLTQNKCILIGDFNSNTIWDKPRREGNHSTVVSRLESKNIFSAYHTFHNQIQGREIHATFSLYRHEDKPYHLDYCFASAPFINTLKSVEVGTHTNWSKYSDHSPLMIQFDL
jgi:exonuclease III